MPENPFEWAMFSFFVIGSFGGLMWLVSMLYSKYNYRRMLAKLEKETEGYEEWRLENYYAKEPKQTTQQTTQLTGRIK